MTWVLELKYRFFKIFALNHGSLVSIKNPDHRTFLLRMHSVSVQRNKRCCQRPLVSENKEMKSYSQGNWSLKRQRGNGMSEI